MATAAVEARAAGAVVHVRLTALATETQRTHTLKTVDQVLKTHGTTTLALTLRVQKPC